MAELTQSAMAQDFNAMNPADALAVVNKYTAKRVYDGKMITGYGYAYNGKTYVTESDAPPHLVNWHEVANDTVQICIKTCNITGGMCEHDCIGLCHKVA